MKLYKIINSFCKNYPDIEDHALKTLLMSDPTFKQTRRGSFVGRYGVWIGNMYANGGIKLGDIPELKSALVTYDKNKTQLPQIKDCKSLSELIEWVKDLSDDFKPVRKQSDAKENLEKVYEDNEWVVYVPHSHAAARRGGEGMRWCTASENDYYYNYYSKQGPLYINIRKSDGARFQFHFESSQFMNADDEPAKLGNIGLSEEIAKFYTKIDPMFKFRLKFDWIEDFREGFASVQLNGKWNFINHEGQLLFQQWLDSVGTFNEGFARVNLNYRHNFINIEGKLLSEHGFDDTYDFHEGFAIVRIHDKWNFINTKGQLLLSKQWFDAVGDFHEGFATVQLNGKCNFINTEGQIAFNQWFDNVCDFSEGFARVELNDKVNFINTEGRLLSKQWFDTALSFSEGFASVQLNGKWNFINHEGQLLSQQWFDWVHNFNEGFATVQLNGKWNFINTEGQFLSPQWFDWVGNFMDGFASVGLNGQDNFINTEGQILAFIAK